MGGINRGDQVRHTKMWYSIWRKCSGLGTHSRIEMISALVVDLRIEITNTQ